MVGWLRGEVPIWGVGVEAGLPGWHARVPGSLLALPAHPCPCPVSRLHAGSPHSLRRLLHRLGGPALRHLRRALLQLPGQLHLRAGGGGRPHRGQLRGLHRQLPLRCPRPGVLPPHAHRAPRDPGGADQDSADGACEGAGMPVGPAQREARPSPPEPGWQRAVLWGIRGPLDRPHSAPATTLATGLSAGEPPQGQGLLGRTGLTPVCHGRSPTPSTGPNIPGGLNGRHLAAT